MALLNNLFLGISESYKQAINKRQGKRWGGSLQNSVMPKSERVEIYFREIKSVECVRE